MIGLIGIVVVIVTVFGGYIASGGKLGIIIFALPYEIAMIGGAAIGAYMISNDRSVIRQTLRDIAKVFRGPQWRPEDYRDLLCLLFELIRVARNSPVDLETHIEAPEASDIFARYPRISADHEAVEMICDTLRAASMTYDDPHQVEEVLEKRIQATLAHRMHTSHALSTVADALPALGIIAAVLGVIKTMASIDQPPEVLGKMIGGALVGTFLGVFLSYGFVGPVAKRLASINKDEAHFYQLIREVLVANLYSHPTNICIEVGRQNTPHDMRPSFGDLEEALRGLRKDAA
ncbi:flagellar motor stator protein MotA [Rhodobaculum claviforme]|uniref:Flagellar motor stator protein MotA n=1 Tax=Rhodobaculum claviforme TaxID=1549854 RepID=A0A934TMV0_9RHOB|nr:flagellar motor stator protein MotA [Rhodobaculum claviforme]MBK5928553.1 flagellar motor stator protein MotA [Rhodobaculum claviforme]